MKLKYLYLALLAVITGIIFLAASSDGTEEKEITGNDKIIKFSHSFHADLTDCASCHSKVAESTTLKDRLMPDHKDCATCHDVEKTEECKTCHYEDVYEPLVQKGTAPEGALHFNHSQHVTKQKIDCENCHKGIKEVDYAFKAKQTDPLMSDCYTCHNNKSIASNSCESCHTSTVNLIPESHKNVAFIKTHKFEANDVAANCVMCHDNNNSCEDCHSASGITLSDAPNDLYLPYAPNSFPNGAKKQKINRVHELNYRFVHGIDAKLKSANCQSCHETETFCATCHQAENKDYTLGGLAPASHLKPDFITIGVGTGGGEHARLAKRDIESCASCHDAQGADPTCITCHLDSDGIKGTNPKTHPRNFMKDVEGDWHSSQGSVCYNCHTVNLAAATAGVGFCGYCHGAK